jgi:hypothetical protein
MISRENKQAMLAMRDEGKSLSAISRHFGVSVSGVCGHLRSFREQLEREKDLPDGMGFLSSRARRALKRMGITSRAQAGKMSAKDFLAVPDLWKATLQEIQVWVGKPLPAHNAGWDGMPDDPGRDGYHYIGQYIGWWGHAWQMWLIEGSKSWLAPADILEKASGPYLGPVPPPPVAYTRRVGGAS